MSMRSGLIRPAEISGLTIPEGGVDIGVRAEMVGETVGAEMVGETVGAEMVGETVGAQTVGESVGAETVGEIGIETVGETEGIEEFEDDGGLDQKSWAQYYWKKIAFDYHTTLKVSF